MINWIKSFFLDLEDSFTIKRNTITIDHTMTQNTPPVEPTMPAPPTSLLDRFCAAIAFREGANPANNNEGNCKFYYGGYLPVYGVVKRSPGGFAMFPTKAQGDLYLCNLIIGIIKEHPQLTFFTFFAGSPSLGWGGYAPSTDGNDPVSNSSQVATACGKLPNSLVAVILG